MDKLIDKIEEKLGERPVEEFIVSKDLRKIDRSYFNFFQKESQNKKIAFIDGGSGEITGSSSYSLQLIRIASTSYKSTEKEDSNLEEFHVLAIDNGSFIDLYYQPAQELPERINLEEEDKPWQACNLVRRLAEIKHLEEVMGDADIVVLDGSFESKHSKEKEYLEKVFEKAKETDNLPVALSKTNNLVTDKGRPASYALLEKAREYNYLREWFYVFSTNELFVKLNKDTSEVFKLDFIPSQLDKVKQILPNLAFNASDPLFKGYPYGLVDADDIARVSLQELSEYKSLLEIRKTVKNIEESENSKNAHSKLDNAKF